MYFVLVLKTNTKAAFAEKLSEATKTPISLDELPKVTVLIPTYNEEQTIYEKMRNVSQFEYPHDRINVFVLDDCSTDKTIEMSEKGFRDFHLEGRILQKKERTGVNASYNQAMEQVDTEYVLTTDADALIPATSLLKATKVMLSLGEVGGIAARMVPIHKNNTLTTRTAVAYSESYNSMLEAESALYSTFPGSTSCMLMRKSAFSPISTSFGSSDGNISLNILRNGFRFIFAPQIEYHEPITDNSAEQRRQKVRRAARLIQSTFSNRKILFNERFGSFGKIVFPLRFLMMTVCPSLLLCSLTLFLISAYLVSQVVFAVFAISLGLIVLIGATTNIGVLSLITSFVIHQIYLLAGLLSAPKRMNVWKKIERTSETVQKLG